MEIRLNGAPHSLDGSMLSDLLAAQRIDATRRGVAVAVNSAVVPRKHWPTLALRPGDEVEIVRPHSGG
ncbi:MAG TPA: sulfur carrier protein ThiS [Alphaproteobacteria bacterium]|nr:sulfur carrier protein ThiS [Alphaproteobacteria bacterium]